MASKNRIKLLFEIGYHRDVIEIMTKIIKQHKNIPRK